MGGIFGGNKSSTTYMPMANALRIQTSCFGRPIPIVYGKNRLSGNLLWYGDFTAIPHSSTQSSGGKGGGGGSQTTVSYTYTTAVAVGLCEGPIIGVGTVWKGKEVHANVTDLFNGGTFLGTYPTQAPWPYLVSKHPGQDIGYQGLAYVAGAPYNLDSQPDLGDHSFEVTGFLPFNAGLGILDADPSAVLKDLLTNANFGTGFPLTQIADWTQFSNYVVANGLFISPILDSQQAAATTFNEICQGVNCEFVFSEGLLKVVPYGDTTITANGATFTPVLTPVYDVNDDDYIYEAGHDPIECERTDPADAFNTIKVEALDRANSYAPVIAESQDQASIELTQQRPANNLTFHWICTVPIAQLVAQLALQRLLYVRNVYKFTLGWRFALLEPMDLITITDSVLGLNKLIVRIKSITENENGELEFMAEDALIGTKSPALFNTSVGIGYATDYNIPPGPVNVPQIFDAPGILTTSGYELWAAVAGGDNWGGAMVYASMDNITFKQAGVINGNSRYGVTSTTLASGVDPDITNNVSVDLSISGADDLMGGSQSDADNLNTLAVIDDEFISFESSTLTGVNQYQLGTYLRRGVFNSTIAAHSAGANFVRLDQALFKYPYDPAFIGKTIYFKFVSFNHYNAAPEDLAGVATYTHVIGGSRSFPSNVAGFSVSQTGYTTVFSWSQVTDSNLSGYEIRYQSAGTPNWDLATTLTSITKGTQVTTSKIPPGNWTFLIKAVDASKKYSQLATVASAVLLSDSVVFFSVQQDGFWTGLNSTSALFWTNDSNLMWNADPTTLMWTGGNFIKHWTGALVPDSQVLASDTEASANGAGWMTFDTAVPHPYLSCTYDAPECDLLADGNCRFYLPFSAEPMPMQASSAISVTTWADNRLAAGVYAGYQPWTSGQVNGRYARARITMDNTLSVGVIRTFSVKADAALRQQNISNVVVTATGTTINYATAYRIVPTITGNATDGSGATVGFDLQTTLTSRVKMYIGGVQVAGTVNVTIAGV